jgi:hypothetical protein
MVTYQLKIEVQKSPAAYLRAKNPMTLHPVNYLSIHVFTKKELGSKSPGEYAKQWVEEHLPDYSGGVHVMLLEPGPGRGNKKIYGPLFAKGPRLVEEIKV